MLSHKPQAGIRELGRWAWRASLGVRGRVAWICALGIMRVGASLGFVWVSKLLIDVASNPLSPNSAIWRLAALLAACLLAELALQQARSYASSLASQRLTNALRRRIFSHLLHSDIYANRRHSGDVLNRLTVDIVTLTTTIINTLPDIVTMIVQLAAAFWLLCAMSPMLALCALIITPICAIASKAYLLKMRRINADIRQGESLIHTHLQEGLQHQMVVQSLECAPEITNRFDRLQQALLGNIIWRSRVSLYSRTTVRLGFITGYLIAFIWSVIGLHTGAITYGIMTAFLQLVGRIQGPIASLSNTLPGLVGTATAIDRLAEIYPLGPSQQPGASPRPSKPLDAAEPVGIRLRGVTFAYPGSGANVLHDFSHDFAPSSKTVIMGPTGVGKSTLTKLILALLSPQAGTIEAYTAAGDAEPISADTRRLMTYVPQGNSLLHGTVRENLLLGNPDATDEDIRQALHIAVANFAYDLPQGLDTQCGELGAALSEGQCQRIAIARALLRKCPVLILDEFNSSLDQPTAHTLLQRLMAARPGSTIIFISHRPEVAAFCHSTLTLGIE